MTGDESAEVLIGFGTVKDPTYRLTWERPDPFPPPPGAVRAAGRPRTLPPLFECRVCRLPFRPRRRTSRCCSPACAARLSLRRRVLIDPDSLWRLADEPSLAAAAARLGVKPDSLRKAMRRAGVPPRAVGRPHGTKGGAT